MNTIQRILKKIKRDIPSRKKPVSKQEGSTLVITLILCGMIITVGLGVVRILASELQFSADLLWSEKAYFAAESGVENALLELKGDPILHISDDPVYNLEYLDGAETFLTIWNKLDKTNNEITIPGASAVKLKLAHKIDGTLDVVDITQLEWKIDGSGTPDANGNSVLWKIICPDSQALTGRVSTTSDLFALFKNEEGDLQDGSDTSSTVAAFWLTVSNQHQQKCWFSIQNISSSPITVTLDADITMPPAIAKVTSIGKSGKREKIVEFKYRQKNLSPYFDFGFIQQN